MTPFPALTRPAHTYLAAARVARAIRGLPAGLSFDDALAFTQQPPWGAGDSISANQKRDEIIWLLELLRERPPRTVLEIGMDRGGTLFLWTRVAAPDALLVSVDLKQIHGRLGRRSPFALVRHSFARDEQRVELLGGVDSHSERTRDLVAGLLGGREVDFLFIDGDHRYESVKRDFELYSPLVREDGLVAFHDVSPATTPDTEGTARFWQELKASGQTTEHLAPGEPGYGIGVYRVGSRLE